VREKKQLCFIIVGKSFPVVREGGKENERGGAEEGANMHRRLEARCMSLEKQEGGKETGGKKLDSQS